MLWEKDNFHLRRFLFHHGSEISSYGGVITAGMGQRELFFGDISGEVFAIIDEDTFRDERNELGRLKKFNEEWERFNDEGYPSPALAFQEFCRRKNLVFANLDAFFNRIEELKRILD